MRHRDVSSIGGEWTFLPCAASAEIINVEGNVNVDFEDVKTIMGEQGQAMMGTAAGQRCGPRARGGGKGDRLPLLEGVDLNGARGVLVNIASRIAEDARNARNHETIRSYASDDATVIFGTATTSRWAKSCA